MRRDDAEFTAAVEYFNAYIRARMRALARFVPART